MNAQSASPRRAWNMVHYQCLTCGKDVERWPSQVKNPNRVFCSVRCRARRFRSGWATRCAVCGKMFRTSPWYAARGWDRCCSKKCASYKSIKGKKIVDGYIKIYLPGHHRGTHQGYVFEHIAVAEKAFGRQIELDEVVHHIDGDRQNNSPSNLVIMSRANHVKAHREGLCVS